MATSDRYHLMNNLNVRSIFDGMTGKSVDDTSLWVMDGETGADMLARQDTQRAKCAELNAKDYVTRRQFGESRAEFAARTAA